jgi:hypothetical protein
MCLSLFFVSLIVSPCVSASSATFSLTVISAAPSGQELGFRFDEVRFLGAEPTAAERRAMVSTAQFSPDTSTGNAASGDVRWTVTFTGLPSRLSDRIEVALFFRQGSDAQTRPRSPGVAAPSMRFSIRRTSDAEHIELSVVPDVGRHHAALSADVERIGSLYAGNFLQMYLTARQSSIRLFLGIRHPNNPSGRADFGPIMADFLRIALNAFFDHNNLEGSDFQLLPDQMLARILRCAEDLNRPRVINRVVQSDEKKLTDFYAAVDRARGARTAVRWWEPVCQITG